MKVVNIYQIGLEVIAEKKKLSKAVVLSPTDLRYKEFLKYRQQWVQEILELEKEYIDTCVLYNNEPLPEVLNWY